jgi:hypothetical protein
MLRAMNREELKVMLDRIQAKNYNLYGIHGFNKYGLQHAVQEGEFVLDKDGSRWVTYFYEKGARADERFFEREEDACKFFLEWIIGYHHI